MGGLQPADFFGGKRGEFRAGGFGGEHFPVVREFTAGLQEGAAGGHEILETGVFAGELLRLGGVGEGVGGAQGRFDLRETAAEALDVGFEVHKRKPPARP